MQQGTAIAIAERWSPRTIALAGLGATLGALLLVIPASGVGDLAAVGAAALVGGATVVAWNRARRIATLPLELAPVAATGTVDGAVVYRFRARLGRGRAFRDPVASVRFEPDEGDAIELATEPLPRVACGPLTIVVRDRLGRVRQPGRFLLHLRVTSAGRAWEADATVETVREGRFAGLALIGGRLAFDERWAAVVSDEP